MFTFRLRPSKCPACSKKLDQISNITGSNRPVVGDFTVCSGCATVLRIQEGMTLRVANALDLSVMSSRNRFVFEVARAEIRALQGGEH